MLVAASAGDAFTHLAARDSIAPMVLAGVPAGFRLAVVALDAHMVAVYDAAVMEARRHGLEARRFLEEGEAMQWLKKNP